MYNIGKVLKEKRKELGLSLDDVVKALRIKQQSLKDIESGQYDKDDIYTLGYIRLYSKYVGINIDEESIKNEVEVSLKNDTDADGAQYEERAVLSSVPSLRVVTISLVIIIISVVFVMFFSDNKLENENISYMSTLKANSQDRIVIKEGSQTYVVHKHNTPLVIKANDSVEVRLFDSENNLLETLYMRIGEIIPFPIKNRSTIVRSSISDAIEISENN